MSRLPLLYYALPAFALAIPTIPVYVYLPSFYAENLGVGLAATGTALLVARILDVITDPLIGIASDRFRLPGGRRKPWILVGAILAAIALVRIFQPPEAVSAVYLAVWSVVLYLGWTMIAVPYTAWGAELSDDYHGRARITGAREAATVLGILVAGGVPAAAASLGARDAEGLALIAWLAIVVGAPTIALLLWRVPETAAKSHPSLTGLPRWHLVVSLFRNRPFMRLLSAWFVNGLANGLPAVLFPLYLQHGLEASQAEQGVLILVYFVSAVAAIPLWLRLSRRFSKHHTWCGAMAMACLAFIWVPLLGPGDIPTFFIICVITGMALGADLALPPAMQADVIDLDRLRTGRERAGLFFALWSMATKLALACAVGFAFPTLELAGFQVDQSNSADAILALALLYAALPTALKVGAIAVVWRHPMTPARQKIIRRRLDSRSERADVAGKAIEPM